MREVEFRICLEGGDDIASAEFVDVTFSSQYNTQLKRRRKGKTRKKVDIHDSTWFKRVICRAEHTANLRKRKLSNMPKIIGPDVLRTLISRDVKRSWSQSRG